MKDSATDAAKTLAGTMVKQSFDAAEPDAQEGRRGARQGRRRAWPRRHAAPRASDRHDERAAEPARPRDTDAADEALHLPAHATHPDWRHALALAQRRRSRRSAAEPARRTSRRWAGSTSPTTTRRTREALLAELQQRWPGVAWVGAVGVGVAASGVEYFDEPALVLMLADLPRAAVPRLLGRHAAGRLAAHTARCMPTGNTPDLAELLVDMSARTATGYLFGGLASSRTPHAAHRRRRAAGRPVGRGLRRRRGAGLARHAGLPAGGPAARHHRLRATTSSPRWTASRRSTACCADLGISLDEPRDALPQLRQHAGRACPTRTDAAARESAAQRGGAFGADTRVRHLIGLDPARHGIAIGDVRRARACSWPSASATPRRRGATWCASAPRSATSSSPRRCRWRPRMPRSAPPMPADPVPPHRRRGLRQLLRPRRAALRRAVGRAADRAARARRRAAGRLLRRRRDRATTTCTATPAC